MTERTWTATELRDALIAYDESHGGYPEHEYEGMAVWLWLLGLGETTSDPEYIAAEDAWNAAREARDRSRTWIKDGKA